MLKFKTNKRHWKTSLVVLKCAICPIYKSLIPESKPLPSSMFNNDLFFPAVVSQQNLARVSFYYWTDQKLFYL